MALTELVANAWIALYVTCSQLVDTAEQRMFGLRRIRSERYENIPGMQLYNQIQPTLFK